MRGGRAPAAPDHVHLPERRGVSVALDARQREGRAGVQGKPPRPEQQPAVLKHRIQNQPPGPV